MQTNDFGTVCRFRQKIVIGRNEIGDFLAVFIRELSRAEDVAFKVNGAIAVWKNGKNGDDVAILYAESFKSVIGCLDSSVARHVDTHHLFALVRLNALNSDPAQLSCNGNAAGQIKDLIQRLLFSQLVNCRPTDLACNRYLWADGRHEDAVARFNMNSTRTHALQHEVIKIDFFHQGLAAEVLYSAVGSGIRGAASGDQCA